MSAESNQGLVRRTFKEIRPDFGDLMDRAIGVKDSGLIPLEVSLEAIKIRVDEIGLEVYEVLEDGDHDVFSRLFVIRNIARDEMVSESALLIEFEGSLWVHNGDFDDFKELMGLMI